MAAYNQIRGITAGNIIKSRTTGSITGRNVYKIGEWGRAMRLVKRMQIMVPLEMHAVMFDWATDTREWLVEKIERQEFNHTPLSPVTRARKSATGGDPRILIDKRDYLDAIRVLPMGPRKWQVGIKRGAKNQKGSDLATIGMVHEYGSARVPARPHWRPTYERAAEDGIVRFKNVLRRAIGKRPQPWVGR